MARILGVSGSLQANSGNLALLRAAQASAPSGVEVVLFDGIRDLPQFDLDLEANGTLAVVDAWRTAIASSDALLVASPEYAFSLPGALKNAIDWVIGTAELEKKIVAITCVSNHPDRGRRGLVALSDTLSAVSAKILGGEPIVRGPNFDADVARLLANVVRAIHDRS